MTFWKQMKIFKFSTLTSEKVVDVLSTGHFLATFHIIGHNFIGVKLCCSHWLFLFCDITLFSHIIYRIYRIITCENILVKWVFENWIQTKSTHHHCQKSRFPHLSKVKLHSGLYFHEFALESKLSLHFWGYCHIQCQILKLAQSQLGASLEGENIFKKKKNKVNNQSLKKQIPSTIAIRLL